MSRRYGVSVISLYPYSLGKTGMWDSLSMSWQARYNGIQAMPLRGWEGLDRYYVECGAVISYEDAWGSPDIADAIRRGNPTNLLLFDSKNFDVPPSVIYSHHEWSNSGVVEIHPELSLDPYEYLSRYNHYGQKFCLDTYHVRRTHSATGKKFNWRFVVDALPSESIGLIHVHLTWKDFDPFFKGMGDTIEILRMLRDKQVQAPVIVEALPPPRAWLYSYRIWWLSCVLNIVRRCLD